MEAPRILLADDHPTVADALCRALSMSGFVTLPVVATWTDVLPAALATRPDVVLVDISLPPSGGTGLDAAAAVSKELPSARCIAVSADDAPRTVLSALDAGCAGFISKTASIEEIPRVVSSVLEFAPVFDARTASTLARFHSSRSALLAERSLTPREIEALTLVCEGHSNPDIADRLCLSRGTVAQLLSSVFQKLGVHDRAAAAAVAVRLSLVL